MIRELPEPIQRFLLGYHAGGVTEADCRACSSPCCSLGGFAILENVIEIYELYRQAGLRRRDHEFEPGQSFEEFVFTHFEVYKRSVPIASGDVVLMLFHMKSLAPDGHLVSIPAVGDYWETRAALFDQNAWLNAGCVFLSHRVQHWPHDDQDVGRHCILHSASSGTAVTAKPIDCVFYTCNAPIQARVPSDEQSVEWFRLLAEHFPNSLERFQRLLGMHADGDHGAAALRRDAMTTKTDRITVEQIHAMGERTSNWGRWGPDDELGTLNHVTAQDIITAAGLIKRGKVFSLGLNFDLNGPQEKSWGNRFNPIHVMLQTGTDAVAGRQDGPVGLRYADDIVSLPLQCGTQWDALSHIFMGEKMWNGYDARLVDSTGAAKNGIEKVKDRMVGRGVLLDVARFKGVDHLEDGCGISTEDLEQTAKAQGVEIRKGDFVIFRTGQMEQRLKAGAWNNYAGGDAPGLRFETAEWIRRTDIAAICADTWGCEVRPNESVSGVSQPWHWVVIPMIGISMGEIFYLKDLAEDCAADKVYEFFFCAPPLPITKAVGSPINPIAIK